MIYYVVGPTIQACKQWQASHPNVITRNLVDPLDLKGLARTPAGTQVVILDGANPVVIRDMETRGIIR